MRYTSIALLILLAGCGGSSPARPTSPSPTPTRVTVSGTITDTSSGTTVGTFVQDVNTLPAFITVQAEGFLTRQTLVSSATPTVDLIREAAPFDLTFYRQMVRGSLDGSIQPIRRLTASPSIYLQTAGLSPSTVAALEAAARAVVPALTGGQLAMAGWETGTETRTPRAGWIVISTDLETVGECGRATIGGGEIHIATRPNCVDAGYAATNLAHELGHTLGFWHVPEGLMAAPAPRGETLPSPRERHHAAIAYKRPIGSADIDVDPRGSVLGSTRVGVD